MKVIEFNNGACQKARRYLDAYLDGELLNETSQEVHGHVEACAACQAEYDTRLRLKSALRASAAAEVAPPYLAGRIRAHLHEAEARPAAWARLRWVATAAGIGAALFGGIFALRQSRLPDLRAMAPQAQESYIDRTAAALPQFLRAGFGDHLHCAMARTHWPRPDEVPADRQLTGNWAPLPEAVTRHVPKQFSLLLAHFCNHRDKRFAHLTYRDNDGRLLSVIVARKADAGALDAAALLPALEHSGIPVYAHAASGYRVSAFTTNDYVVQVISTLDQASNTRTASAMASGVRQVLDAAGPAA